MEKRVCLKQNIDPNNKMKIIELQDLLWHVVDSPLMW